jgi:hypothetical protein
LSEAAGVPEPNAVLSILALAASLAMCRATRLRGDRIQQVAASIDSSISFKSAA